MPCPQPGFFFLLSSRLLLMILDGFFPPLFLFPLYLLSSSPPSPPQRSTGILREVHKSTDREDGGNGRFGIGNKSHDSGVQDWSGPPYIRVIPTLRGRRPSVSFPAIILRLLFSREEYMVSASFRLWSRRGFLTETPIESHPKTALSVIIHRGLLRPMKWACVCVCVCVLFNF